MTAISKNWVAIGDAAVDADSPIDQALVEGFRDDLVHLREWMGASYTTGAVQDHNHDGSNSALVEIGSNYLRNGSFENGTEGWTFTNYTGGSNAVSTTSRLDGAKSIELTSTVLANGGCQGVSNSYIPCGTGEVRALNFWVQASAANISSKVESVWYDNTQALISATTLLSYADTPTTDTFQRLGCVPPANARFMRIRITGGVPAVGSGTGTVRFDGISLHAAGSGLLKVLTGTAIAQAQVDLVMTDFNRYRNKRLMLSSVSPVTDGVNLLLQFSTNGGSSYDTGVGNYTWAFSSNLASVGTNDAGSTGDSSIVLAVSVGSDVGESVNMAIDIFDTNVSSAYTRCDYKGSSFSTLGTMLTISGCGGRVAAQDTDALRICFGSGNIAAIAYSLYVWN